MTRAKNLATLVTDLLNSASNALGAALVSFNSGLAYTAGSIGAFLNALATSAGATSVGYDDSVAYASGTIGKALKNAARYLTDTGAVNALVLTTGGTVVYSGMTVLFKPANTNTISGVTMNVNTTGAVAVVNNKGVALAAADLIAGQVYAAVYDGGTSKWWLVTPVPSQSAVFANGAALAPAGVVSTTGLMAGMGSTVAITPLKTGRLYVHVSGMMQNSVANQAATAQLYYGTGAAPGASAALAGTLVPGAYAQDTLLATVANAQVPFGFGAIISGLTVGTAYWLDLALSNGGGSGTAFVTGVKFSIIEI